MLNKHKMHGKSSQEDKWAEWEICPKCGYAIIAEVPLQVKNVKNLHKTNVWYCLLICVKLIYFYTYFYIHLNTSRFGKHPCTSFHAMISISLWMTSFHSPCNISWNIFTRIEKIFRSHHKHIFILVIFVVLPYGDFGMGCLNQPRQVDLFVFLPLPFLWFRNG